MGPLTWTHRGASIRALRNTTRGVIHKMRYDRQQNEALTQRRRLRRAAMARKLSWLIEAAKVEAA